jgi:hypothetical protein
MLSLKITMYLLSFAITLEAVLLYLAEGKFMSVSEQKMACVNEFIALANKMKDDGLALQLVSSSLMTACALYATYVVTGNDGALRESGVDKLTKLFGDEVRVLQARKIEQAQRDGKDVSAAQTT